MRKVLVIFGTRPEAIKMAPIVRELQHNQDAQPIVCVTAQHRGMLDQVLEIFHIVPDYDLDIMQQNQTLAQITSRVLSGVEQVILSEQPDVVLVHGDTTTAMASALAAFYQETPIGHVEAGLRTYDKYSPFPEEMNRQIIDRLADYLFAPTKISAEHLSRDLNHHQKIIVTGNTAIDALKLTVSSSYKSPLLDWLGSSKLILVTAHRRENLGRPMRHIFRAIRKLVEAHPDIKVIYPVHLNPRVQEVAQEELGNNERIKLIAPLDVLDFHNLMDRAYIIMSDSGGVQEEAPSLGKPVLVLRRTTERPEGVNSGTLKLVGTETEQVFQAADRLLRDTAEYSKMSHASNPYGDGYASRRIVNTIITG